MLSLKSYEGGYKVLIIWQADKMNTDTSNKFLNFLEEPPKNTYIILTADNTKSMLQTILSRTQIVEVPRIGDEDLAKFLKSNDAVEDENIQAVIFQAQGNYNSAQKLLHTESSDSEFEELFVMWVREAFQVKKKTGVLEKYCFMEPKNLPVQQRKTKEFFGILFRNVPSGIDAELRQ